MRKFEAEPISSRPRAQKEPSGPTETETRNHRLRAQLRLVIAVPAHGITTIAVQVGECTVECRPTSRAEAIEYRQ